MSKKCTFSTMNNCSIVRQSAQKEVTRFTLTSICSTIYGVAIALIIWFMSTDIFAQGAQNT